jgi:hypothetical protein
MQFRIEILAVALTAVFGLAVTLTGTAAQSQDLSKFPDWKGQWVRIGGGGQFDPTKPPVRGQQPPLKPEFQAIWEANIADGRQGGQYYNTQVRCMPGGMPRMMMAYEPMEVIILPDITYIHITFNSEFRRIYTDGRDWPKEAEVSFSGYSIGNWVDTDGDGKFDILEVETRGFKGPRHYDASQLPLHHDNQSVFKERFYLNKDNPGILHDEITVIDNALTRPWTVRREYHRNPSAKPEWREFICAEGNGHLRISNENYYLSADGLLMPIRKDQPPPDLRYFKGVGRAQ